MASESTEGRSLSLDLPATLDEWLTERASDLGVEREELVVQLLGSYRTTADAQDGDEAVEAFETALDEATVDVESVVEEAVAEALEGAVPDEEALVQRVQERTGSRVDTLEADMDEKLDDVRRRVLQVKQEADGKAPADHDHEEFAGVDELRTRVDELRDRVATLSEQVDDSDTASREELADVERKLTQLARVVVRMRDEAGTDVLDDIRRKAAREGYETADCGACGERVRVGLLPEAACPHCGNEFGDIVAASGGLFGTRPRLTGRHERAEPDADRAPDEGPVTRLAANDATGDGDGGTDADHDPRDDGTDAGPVAPEGDEEQSVSAEDDDD